MFCKLFSIFVLVVASIDWHIRNGAECMRSCGVTILVDVQLVSSFTSMYPLIFVFSFSFTHKHTHAYAHLFCLLRNIVALHIQAHKYIHIIWETMYGVNNYWKVYRYNGKNISPLQSFFSLIVFTTSTITSQVTSSCIFMKYVYCIRIVLIKLPSPGAEDFLLFHTRLFVNDQQ